MGLETNIFEYSSGREEGRHKKEYPVVLSRCDTYRDTWVTMRYVSRYLFIALVSA